MFRAELHPAIAANPLHHLHHRRHRERHAGIPLDRRQRLLRDPDGGDQGRLRFRARLAFWRCLLRARSRGEIPLAERRSRLRVHEPRDARDAGRRAHQARRCCGCSTARRCGAQGAAAAAPAATATRGEHEGRRRALSGVDATANGSSTSSSGSMSAAPSPEGAGARATRAASCSR